MTCNLGTLRPLVTLMWQLLWLKKWWPDPTASVLLLTNTMLEGRTWWKVKKFPPLILARVPKYLRYICPLFTLLVILSTHHWFYSFVQWMRWWACLWRAHPLRVTASSRQIIQWHFNLDERPPSKPSQVCHGQPNWSRAQTCVPYSSMVVAY